MMAPAACSDTPPRRGSASLLDIGLPVMDGYELAERLRTLFAHRPVRFIAITGYGQEVDRRRSRDAGFALHLVKPVDTSRILDGLQQVAETFPSG
jgi:CheY-like chemotaxis protein